MFGLTPVTLWLIIGLVFTNLATVVAWRVTDARLESATAETVACAARHEAFVAQVQVEGQKAKQRTAEIIAKNNTIIEDIKHEYSTAIDRVRNDYAGRLRRQAARSSGSGVLPAVPSSTPGPDAADPDPIPAPERIASDCAETTVTANFLQAFIEQQSEASKP